MERILEIKESEKVFLPKKYHELNNLCAIVYNQLTEVYVNENYRALSYTDIDISNSEKKINEVKSGKLGGLNWLKANNRNEEIEMVLTKHLTKSITTDFINFIFESLYIAKSGKLTVAYSLLRKPFCDLLLMLEQMLIDREGFIDRFFHQGNPKEYDY